MRWKYYAKLWLCYMRIGLLCMTQYPADTLIWLISMIVREACGFIGILAVASVTGGLGTWGFYEICLLFSMCSVIEAIGQAFFDNVWSIDKMIRRGEMDVFLIRPASPFVQMLGQIMHFQAVLSMVVYVGILAWSIHGIGLSVGVREIVLLVEYVIFGTVINSGIYTIFNSLNFWIVQGDDIAVLVQTCREFVKYPLQVFPAAIQGFFTYVLPLGFVAYYPVLGLLGRTDMPVMILLPCVAALVAGIAAVIWRLGLKGYNSTGT